MRKRDNYPSSFARSGQAVFWPLAMLLASACGGAQAAWDAPPAATLGKAIATATRMSPATRTPETRLSATPAPTATPLPTDAPLPDAPPTANADEAYWARFPKDEQGRVIGGKYNPVINYTPTMVTGKACARVNRWELDYIIVDKLPNMAVAAPRDRCVIQNAIDDYARTLFASPARYPLAEFQRDILPLYKTDPALMNGLAELYRTQLAALYERNEGVVRACTQPTYLLFDTTPSAWMVTDNTGAVGTHGEAQTLELRVVYVAKNLAPFTCVSRWQKDNAIAERDTRPQAPARLLRVWLIFDPVKQRWTHHGLAAWINDNDIEQKARRLYDSAAVKP